MPPYADILRDMRRSALALARAQAWNRRALYAERDAAAAMRRGDARAEAEHLAEMQRAARLSEQNLRVHETLRAALGN